MSERRPDRLLRIGLTALVVALLALTPVALALAGDLDPTFDGDGIAITDFGKSEFAQGLTIQRDGKIVVVGGDTEVDPPRYIRDFVLARYLGNGGLDPAFGGGRVRTDFGGGSDSAAAVVEQGDGKLVAAGLTAAPSGLRFALVRYNADSSLDPTFDGDGMVVVTVGESASASAAALQRDGRIVAAGESCTTSGNCDFAVARLNADGSLDTTLEGDGTVLTDLSAGDDVGTAVGIQDDGRIVVAGIAFPSRDVLLARYGSDGHLDTSFDGDGKVRTTVPCCAIWPRLAIQSDGRIVVAAGSQLLRYRTDGSLDPVFGQGGRVDGTAGTIDAVVLQPDGKIIVAGRPRDSSGFAVSRYETGGLADLTFHWNVVPISQHSVRLAGAGLQANRKIVVAGSTGTDAGHLDFIVLRFLNPAPPAARCRVPSVQGKTLNVARRSIRRARCTVGKVTRKFSGRVKKGRIISQSPRAGRLVPAGGKVRLVVSRGRKR